MKQNNPTVEFLSGCFEMIFIVVTMLSICYNEYKKITKVADILLPNIQPAGFYMVKMGKM
jgi:hypothetical protein